MNKYMRQEAVYHCVSVIHTHDTDKLNFQLTDFLSLPKDIGTNSLPKCK